MPIPPLVVPPRPPELPTTPPPPPAVPAPSTQTGPHLRNDAFLSIWVEQLERVLKDAWVALNNAIVAIEARLTYLETRIADTYTFGQKGALVVDELVALPLRVVRDEKLKEVTLAAELPPTEDMTVEFRHNGAAVTTLTLGSGDTFAVQTLPAPRALLANDVLAVGVLEAGGDGGDVVAQIRCV